MSQSREPRPPQHYLPLTSLAWRVDEMHEIPHLGGVLGPGSWGGSCCSAEELRGAGTRSGGSRPPQRRGLPSIRHRLASCQDWQDLRGQTEEQGDHQCWQGPRTWSSEGRGLNGAGWTGETHQQVERSGRLTSPDNDTCSWYRTDVRHQ